MKNMTFDLSKNEKLFLSSMLEYGNITDAEISRKTNLSKATCSRLRKKIERTLISEYIPIIHLDKIGINVFLVLSFKWTAFNNSTLTKKLTSDLKNDPHSVFLASGEGSSANTVVFIAFENLEQCHQYLKEFRKKYGAYAEQINTLLLPSTEIIKNDFMDIIKYIIGGKKK